MYIIVIMSQRSICLQRCYQLSGYSFISELVFFLFSWFFYSSFTRFLYIKVDSQNGSNHFQESHIQQCWDGLKQITTTKNNRNRTKFEKCLPCKKQAPDQEMNVNLKGCESHFVDVPVLKESWGYSLQLYRPMISTRFILLHRYRIGTFVVFVCV